MVNIAINGKYYWFGAQATVLEIHNGIVKFELKPLIKEDGTDGIKKKIQYLPRNEFENQAEDINAGAGY